MKITAIPMIVGVIAVAGLVSSPIRAEAPAAVPMPATPVARLMKLLDISKSSKEQAKVAFAPSLEKFRKQGISEAGIAEISAAADRFFSKVFEDPAMVTELEKIYSKVYTDQEIELLLAFYDTPVGRKSLTTMPQVMAECMQVGQKLSMKNQAAFQSELQGIIARYARPAAGTPPGR